MSLGNYSPGKVNGRVIITDENGRLVGVDRATNALNVMQHEHHEIHQGSHFYLCNTIAFTNGQVIDFTNITPDSAKWLHLTYSFQGTGALSLEIFEGATVDVPGTVITPINNNRNSATTSSSIARVGDTYTDTGTSIYKLLSGGNKVAGFIERAREIILKQNTTYIFRLTNETTLANNISYCAEWYEHTDKNAIEGVVDFLEDSFGNYLTDSDGNEIGAAS